MSCVAACSTQKAIISLRGWTCRRSRRCVARQAAVPPNEVDPFNLREPIRTKPMVIALKGISFTVAIELMLAADIAIAADNCRFSSSR